MEITDRPEDVKMTYWQHLSIETRHHLSDLDFYEGEAVFLRNLIGKYLHWLMEEDYFPHIRTVLQNLQQVDNRITATRTEYQSIVNRLGLLIENPFAQDESRIRESYVQAADNLRDLVTEFRSVKNEIFEMVEQTLRTEKARKLLGMPVQPHA